MKLLAALAVLTFCAAAIPVRAQDPAQKKADAEQKAMRIVQSLQYQTGEITLLDGKAKIKLTDDFKFLDPANARKVLVDLWRNPPGAGSVTGMIVPKGFLVTDGWAAVLQWSDVGYVKDSDYDGIDFQKMLDQLKEKNVEESKNREAAGYGPMLLTGWATAPHYDKQSHKLYWAKSFDVKRSEQALNYDIRVLGRSGVMELSMLAGMSELAEIEAKVPAILGMVDFTDGNRYTDFKPGTDKVAAYGIAGLIAGGVLAKAGFFKVIFLFAAKFFKVIIVAAVALFAGLAKLFGKKNPRSAESVSGVRGWVRVRAAPSECLRASVAVAFQRKASRASRDPRRHPRPAFARTFRAAAARRVAECDIHRGGLADFLGARRGRECVGCGWQPLSRSHVRIWRRGDGAHTAGNPRRAHRAGGEAHARDGRRASHGAEGRSVRAAECADI